MALTAGQSAALHAMNAGRNVFLSGEAGTGKSFVLRTFLEQTDRNVVVCAPTGIAAINVGGTTLHRAFKVPMDPIGPEKEPQTVQEVIEKAQTIVIDEISMCRFDVFEFVAKSIRKAEKKAKHKKQLIVVGDFLQLPPVVTDKDRKALDFLWGDDAVRDGFAFQAPMWQDFDFVTVVLDEVMRQKGDSDFVTKLNDVRRGRVDALDWFNANAAAKQPGICLCATNKEAERINSTEIEKLKGRARIYRADSQGNVSDTDKPVADFLKIKPGMRVMSVINAKTGEFQNGTLGTVKTAELGVVLVHWDNGVTAEVEPYTWDIFDYKVDGKEVKKVTIGSFRQMPLKPAYAITIHKSQGQTYDSVNVYPNCFADGQLYVALSRCKTIEHLHLVKKIKPEWLRTSGDVLAFYGYNSDSVTNSNEPVVPPEPAPPAVPAEIVTESKTEGRGGKRDGAGRRGKYGSGPTKTIRVPVAAIPEIEALLASKKWE